MPDYQIKEYIRKRQNEVRVKEDYKRDYDFLKLCEKVKDVFYLDWENRESSGISLEVQKRAIIGYEKEKNFFIDRIYEIVTDLGASLTSYPSWYKSLEEAIYQENWGLSGLSEWFTDKYLESSSAKIIGENIFFMLDGKMNLMPQKISAERKEQLIKAFLLLRPKERMDKAYYELYMLDGTRVTIYGEPMAKEGQAAIVFRRYIIPKLSFEEQASRHTIPKEIIPLFKFMVNLGFNMVFMGAVRTAKTTFLSTWQSYEDPSLEGVMVETDPEIPLDKILPGSPVLQILADGNDLKAISKNLLRSDADYFIMAEARDGIALDTALRIASKGTKRMKITFHSRDPYQFPLDGALEIVKQVGGDINLTMKKLASSFDYIFHFIQLKNKSEKRLSGIYEMSLEDGEIRIKEVLSYDPIMDNWSFTNVFSNDKIKYAMETDLNTYKELMKEGERLAKLRVLN